MKIAVLVSGGVDSSLALKLLADQGHQLEAFYLKIWLEDELSYLGSCPWEEDLAFVQKTCQILSIPLHIISMQQAYHDRVVAHTLSEIRAGRTPNPDILCNQFIKFGLFYDMIDSSFEKVATGHYAQLEETEGIYFLKRAPDPIKDQTYFLCNLSQKQLARALFPIGHLTKEQVRKLARAHHLPSSGRKDSQGICFLGKFKFSDFLTHHLGKQAGPIKEFESRKIIGSHDGHWFYTIGQRQGIRLSAGPWYVVAKDEKSNTVFVSHNYAELEEIRNRFSISECTWVNGKQPENKNLLVKVRHRAPAIACSLEALPDNKLHVLLSRTDQGIAPGQHAVFYEGDLCSGKALIS